MTSSGHRHRADGGARLGDRRRHGDHRRRRVASASRDQRPAARHGHDRRAPLAQAASAVDSVSSVLPEHDTAKTSERGPTQTGSS